MGSFIKRDVVVLPFPYSDLSNTTKKRPALVVADIDGDDVICCMITSVLTRTDRYSISLENADFDSGSLKQDSNIRPNRLFTADAAIIKYKAGEISPDKMEEVVEQIKEIIEN